MAEKELLTGDFVCHTECFYNLHLWKVGDVLKATPDCQPNQHFSRDGSPPAFRPMGASEDNRSTSTMKRLLVSLYGFDEDTVDDMGRKQAYKALKTAEAEEESRKEAERKAARKKASQEEDAAADICLGDMTADEIEQLTKAQIAEALNGQHGANLSAKTIDKTLRADLLDMLIAAETKAGL